MNRIGQVVGELAQSFALVWRQQQALGKVILGIALIALLSCPVGLLSLARPARENIGSKQASPNTAEDTPPTEAALAAAPTPSRAPVPTFTPLPSPSPEPSPEPTATVRGAWAQVLDVIDGDTIVVLKDGQQRVVSYLGIEAPRFGEGGQPDEGLASEARVANTVLVQGKVVRMEGKEGWVNDRGHLLCYVWLDDELVNAELVRLGYASCDASLVGSPYLDTLVRLEQEAQQRQAGIWAQTEALLALASQPMAPVPASPLDEPTPPEVAAPPETAGLAAAPVGADAPTPSILAMDLVPSPIAPAAPLATTEAMPTTPASLPPATAVPTPTEPPPPPPPTPVPPPTAPPQAPVGGVQITKVHADGEKGRAEPDEYCEIKNSGASEVHLQGWRLNAGAKGQDFVFPAVVLAPGHSCRVYTNEQHPESGGLSFDSGTAIWKNDGDCGYLYDASGQQVHSYCY